MDYPRGVEVVSAALIVRKGKILLVKSHKWGDIWLLPGGHVEPGETVLDAAKREGEEETGLKLKPLFCVNFGEVINDPDFNRTAHLVYFHCVCEAVTDTVILDEKELKESVWVTPEDALRMGVRGRAEQTIKNFMAGTKIEFSSVKY